jgi:hypothetical protein
MLWGFNGDTGASQLSCYSSSNEGVETRALVRLGMMGSSMWKLTRMEWGSGLRLIRGGVCKGSAPRSPLVMPPILVGSSPSWRTDLPSRFRSSHGRCGIGLHVVYQEKEKEAMTGLGIFKNLDGINFVSSLCIYFLALKNRIQCISKQKFRM